MKTGVSYPGKNTKMDEHSSPVTSTGNGIGGGSGDGNGSPVDCAAAGQASGALLAKPPGGLAHTLDQVDHVRKLLGVDNRDFDLPGIAVIGGQSAGKSSVVELLSGVSLPRRALLVQHTLLNC